MIYENTLLLIHRLVPYIWDHKRRTKEENVSSNTLFSIQWRDIEDTNKGNSFIYYFASKPRYQVELFICKQIPS